MLKQDIHLKFSKIYLIFLFILLLGSFLSLSYLGLSWGSIFIIVYSFYCLRSRQNFESLKSLGENRWVLRTSKNTYLAYLCGDSVLTSEVCILRFKVLGGRFKKTCLIFRDSIERNLYRALLVELYAARKYV